MRTQRSCSGQKARLEKCWVEAGQAPNLISLLSERFCRAKSTLVKADTLTPRKEKGAENGDWNRRLAHGTGFCLFFK